MISETQIAATIDRILKREGGNVDDPDDLGGETHFGITMPFASQWHLPWPPTLSDARIGYRAMLAGTKIDQIPDSITFDLVADCAVQHGDSRAVKWLQRALAVSPDGVIGPQTIGEMSSSETMWFEIDKSILTERFKFYAAICVNDPTQLKFLVGWINRATEFLT